VKPPEKNGMERRAGGMEQEKNRKNVLFPIPSALFHLQAVATSNL
jgi:hypothetical protein